MTGDILIQIIYWACVLGVIYTYVLFPALLYAISGKKKLKYDSYSRDEALPTVSILLSIYNEEAVIADKLTSMLSSNYPVDKLEILVGSDNSTDRSNTIVEEFAKKYPNVLFKPFTERQGKIGRAHV